MGESEARASNGEWLQSLDQDFQSLQSHFAAQLAQDIEYLKSEKLRLLEAIEGLRQEYEQLQTQYRSLQAETETALTQQQRAQQQRWAKQMAQVLAQQLRETLVSSLADDSAGQTQPWLQSFDQTLAQTLQSLQHDLSSYQSAVAQQLVRMQTMEQQGEAILESLVSRLSQQLQQPVRSHPEAAVYLEPSSQLPMTPTRRWMAPYPGKTLELGWPPPPLPEADVTADNGVTASRRRSSMTSVQKGLVIGAIATLLLAMNTVLVGAISQGGAFLGIPLAGLDQFSFLNATALLWLRLLVVMPVLLLLAPRFHQPVWQDLQTWFQTRQPLLPILGSGFFLFCSQAFFYQAVGAAGPAIATALLFLYPLITIPLMGRIRGKRPTPLRWVVMAAISMGGILVAWPALEQASTAGSGIGAALLAAITFALYILTMRRQQRCHPISTGILQFGTMSIISSLLLLITPLGLTSGVVQPWNFVLGGLSLGLLTSVAYFLNYTGVRLMGGNRSALLSASTPLLTAILAWILMPTAQISMHLIQWTGLILISLGGLTLAIDRLGPREGN
jgi:drug/metabolite transporter (DMT)-like permease